MSLRRRIAIAAGLAVAIAVLAVAVGVYAAVRSQLRGQVEDAIAARAEALVQAPPVLRRAPGPPDERRLPLDEPPFVRPAPAPEARFGGPEGVVQFLRPDAAPLGPSGGVDLPVDAAAREIADAGSGRSFRDAEVDGTRLRVVTLGAGPQRGAVQVARPLTEVDETLDEVVLILALAVAGGIALAVALGAAVARTALTPIGRFTERTETISAAPDPSQRIEAEGDDELARLARSFNATLDALQTALDAQRQLVADASHELRTPIASLRANIQVLEDADRLSAAERESLRADVVEELDELTALVADVVELARGAKPQELRDDVRLDEIVAHHVERARRRAGDEPTLELETEPTLVRGDPDRISRAVSNLLDNALKWSPPGAPIEVRLSDGCLTVRDHGPGFDEADLGRVFERFYRAKEARGKAGSGLGLAIVRHAAETHGGSVSAENAPGGGALLTVDFGQTLPLPAHAGDAAVP